MIVRRPADSIFSVMKFLMLLMLASHFKLFAIVLIGDSGVPTIEISGRTSPSENRG